MIVNQGFGLFIKHWAITLTMVIGSFIAGASSEGGGAIAYPVFTLLMDVSPGVARNFSYAIQSIGMTAASLMIIGLRIKIEVKAIIYASIGGIIGLIVGAYFIVDLLQAGLTKLLFVSLWLSFGFALFLTNSVKNRVVIENIGDLTGNDVFKLILFGVIGGMITSIFGNGIDIFTFCLLTLFFGLSEKVATPTSVVLMTINTIAGFFLHAFIMKDFQVIAFEYWMVSIPVVIIFAPLGAFLISKVSRKFISTLLYSIILIQFIGALFIIKPNGFQILMSICVILTGFIFFWRLSKNTRKSKVKLATTS
ncbi:TSUP family transporter [Ascidiimonas sp. W6]|uniref:TSUP family transporter n=1 Tax=Ascidiimonas meishanensis TaxID=3128903 RepID=UPI0030EB36F9